MNDNLGLIVAEWKDSWQWSALLVGEVLYPKPETLYRFLVLGSRLSRF